MQLIMQLCFQVRLLPNDPPGTSLPRRRGQTGAPALPQEGESASLGH